MGVWPGKGFVGRCDGEWEVKRLNRGMDCGTRPTATLTRVLNAGDTEGAGVCTREITERNQRDTNRGVKGGRRGCVFQCGESPWLLPHISAEQSG